MTKRPWHERLAATAVFPWWVNLALGLYALGRSAATAVRIAAEDGSVAAGDVTWAVAGFVAGIAWLAIAYAKRRHREALDRP